MAAANSSCLSVFGLAWDATEREVHVLFSACPGYVRCIVVPGKGGGQKPFAFVQFSEQQDALAALETRQGTNWEQGSPAVSIEFAKRNIPDNFVPRQVQGADWASHHPPAAPAPVVVAPTPKRPRLDVVGRAAVQEVIGKSGGGGCGFNHHAAPIADTGPKTLHIGGLPPALAQEDLDAFLLGTFGSSFVGGALNDSGGSGRACRAFVGFVSNKAASDALASLEGFTWEGHQLRAEWARSEYRAAPGGGGAPGGGAPLAAMPVVGASMQAPPGGGGCGGGVRGGGKGGDGGWGAPPRWQAKGGGKGKDSWQPSRKTLHFTNLPAGIAEHEFEQFLSATFPDMVVCAHFKDTHDGRPPVAWVLFVNDDVAASVVSSHQNFDLGGTQVVVQFARTELDPMKFRGKGGS